MEHKGSVLAYKRNLCAHLTRAAVALRDASTLEAPHPCFRHPRSACGIHLAGECELSPRSALLLLPLFLNLTRSNTDLAQVRSRDLKSLAPVYLAAVFLLLVVVFLRGEGTIFFLSTRATMTVNVDFFLFLFSNRVGNWGGINEFPFETRVRDQIVNSCYTFSVVWRVRNVIS